MENMEKHIIAARDEAFEMYKKYQENDSQWDKEMSAFWQGKFIAYSQTIALLRIYK